MFTTDNCCLNRHFLSEESWFVIFLLSYWKSLNGDITACTHSEQESVTSADNLGMRGGKAQSCVSASVREPERSFLYCGP